MRDQDYDYIRSYYGVPAANGAAVTHPRLGKGRITHASGRYLWITWDMEPNKERGPYHPTDSLTYS